MDWQPIETAPKSASYFEPIRILATNGGDVSVTYWVPVGSGGEWRNEAEVTDDGYGAVFHADWSPTFWMPLPPPPDKLGA